MDMIKHSKWLGITTQQCRILEAILAIKKRGETANPKSIRSQEAEMFRNAPIQKSNFFSQLRTLQGKGYVRKLGDASYDLNLQGMLSSLKSARKEVLEEAGDLEKAMEDAEDYFNAYMANKELEATFLPYERMQERFADMLSGSRVCYVTGLFPRLLYGHSRVFMKDSGSRKYSNTLWERCIEKRELEITYLTRLDVDYLYKRLLSACGDQVIAKDEAEKVLKNLETLLAKNEKLKMYYSPSPYGIDIGIPDVERLKDLFLFFRKQDKEGVGAVYLNSPQMVIRFRNLFRQECDSSVDLKGPDGPKALEKAWKKLERIKA